jgi:hypothetical protein
LQGWALCASKNPAELPASRSNSGAGTEKRPGLMGLSLNGKKKKSREKVEKIRKVPKVSFEMGKETLPRLLPGDIRVRIRARPRI